LILSFVSEASLGKAEISAIAVSVGVLVIIITVVTVVCYKKRKQSIGPNNSKQKWVYLLNRPFPNSLQWPRNNGSKLRLNLIIFSKCMKTSSPTSTWNHCFVVTEAKSGKVYFKGIGMEGNLYLIWSNTLSSKYILKHISYFTGTATTKSII
jgi:hypothetical protein